MSSQKYLFIVVEKYFNSDAEELAFYRLLHSKMNACIYVLNHHPYGVEWVTQSKMLVRAVGMTAEQIAEIGEQLPYWLSNNDAQKESIKDPLKKFETDDDTNWGGTYRFKNAKGQENWIGYTVSLLTKGLTVYQNKYVVVAWMMDDICHTKNSLDEYIQYLSACNHTELRSNLSERQMQVLTQIAEGATVRKIAISLNLSPYTVEDYKQDLYKKLSCNNQKELVAMAKVMGI